MGLDFITHKGRKYLNHESIGGASLWIRPLAQHYCYGKGLDIGYSKEAWMLPGAIGIEPNIDPAYDAMKLPPGEFDYIHSSHCLEHVNRNIYDVLDYWLSKIKVGGILFLYLPHSSQTYWHPSSNRKHIHSLNESEIETYLNDLGHKVYVSGCDWNHSFVVICEKTYGKPTHENLVIALTDIQKEQIKSEWRKHQQDEHVKTNKPFIPGNADIPTGHYHVKDSLLYNFPKKTFFEQQTPSDLYIIRDFIKVSGFGHFEDKKQESFFEERYLSDRLTHCETPIEFIKRLKIEHKLL